MRLRVTPRAAPFVDALSGLATVAHKGTLTVRDTLGVDLLERSAELERLRVLQRDAERRRSELVDLTRESFVAPFDRGDIHQLTVTLAEVLTHLERAVDGGIRHRIDDPAEGTAKLIDVLIQMAELTAQSLPGLRTLGDVGDYPVQLRRLGVRADQMRRDLLTEALDRRSDPLRALRVTLVVEELTAAVHDLERAATVVEGIVVKES